MLKVIICFLILCFGLIQPVTAGQVGAGPIFNIVQGAHGPLPIPVTYVVERFMITFTDNQLPLTNPADIFICPRDNLYILDVNRVIKYAITEDGLVYVKTYHLTGDTAVSGASGIFVDIFGDIFIADTNNNRVLVVGADGGFVEEFVQPDSPLYNIQYAFRPYRVALDILGQLFILNDEDDSGFIVLDAHNRFMGYIAPSEVGAESFVDLLIRRFATQQQRERIGRRTRPMHSNFVFAADNTFYVVSSRANTNQIMRFTAVGNNIFPLRGDLSFPLPDARLVDVAVDSAGNVSVLDNSSGFIVQYSAQGVMLTAFGGRGGWAGTFINPVALDIDSHGRIYVLDRATGAIQIFRPTAFMNQVHAALELYSEGRYSEAYTIWQEIHSIHSAYPAAAIGLARAYFRQENFIGAMRMYRHIYNTHGYSYSFEQWRLLVLREYFGRIVLGIIALIIIVSLVTARLRRYAINLASGGNAHRVSGLDISLMVIFAPTEGFRRIKEDRSKFCFYMPALILLGLLGVRIFNIMFVHFPHASVLPEYAIFTQEILAVLIPVILWGCCVYLTTTILSGETKFREMMAATMYALLPIVIFTIPLTLFSLVLSGNEAGLYNTLFGILFVWSGILLLISISVMNTYTYKQTLLVAFLTAFALAFMVVVSALVYSLGLQVVSFLRQIISEYRILIFHN